MKVIILGAGQVGASVAEGLVSEENDITVVDYDGQRLTQLQDRLDLRTVVGNAATPSVLRAAGAADADMIIAVTQSLFIVHSSCAQRAAPPPPEAALMQPWPSRPHRGRTPCGRDLRGLFVQAVEGLCRGARGADMRRAEGRRSGVGRDRKSVV